MKATSFKPFPRRIPLLCNSWQNKSQMLLEWWLVSREVQNSYELHEVSRTQNVKVQPSNMLHCPPSFVTDRILFSSKLKILQIIFTNVFLTSSFFLKKFLRLMSIIFKILFIFINLQMISLYSIWIGIKENRFMILILYESSESLSG